MELDTAVLLRLNKQLKQDAHRVAVLKGYGNLNAFLRAIIAHAVNDIDPNMTVGEYLESRSVVNE